MNLILKILFALIDLVCFVGGSFLFIYSVIQIYFSQTMFGEDEGNYDYSVDSTEYIAIAIGLIVLGIVIRSWRKGLPAGRQD